MFVLIFPWCWAEERNSKNQSIVFSGPSCLFISPFIQPHMSPSDTQWSSMNQALYWALDRRWNKLGSFPWRSLDRMIGIYIKPGKFCYLQGWPCNLFLGVSETVFQAEVFSPLMLGWIEVSQMNSCVFGLGCDEAKDSFQQKKLHVLKVTFYVRFVFLKSLQIQNSRLSIIIRQKMVAISIHQQTWRHPMSTV